MAVDPGEVDGPDALRGTAVASGPGGSVPRQEETLRKVFMKALSAVCAGCSVLGKRESPLAFP
jgi:hypothetical protein